ncbi:30S ribosomal protein S10 [Spiroplasma endosymbiont of Aspidapion aeneum]|uniref:30S ribosomal protein S10 n=1 Tax=Spiroplasma endosymbiont of Aspidapion aeneum TaxID=3066276 RepID=UPI00313F32F5
MGQQNIRIKIKGFDHIAVDNSAKKIISAAESTGTEVIGPIPLPTHKNIITILRPVHKYKDSREQFEIRTHQRIIDLKNTSPQSIDALQRLNLPKGVSISIKIA